MVACAAGMQMARSALYSDGCKAYRKAGKDGKQQMFEKGQPKVDMRVVWRLSRHNISQFMLFTLLIAQPPSTSNEAATLTKQREGTNQAR
jgi:hypothetical protein